MSESVTIGGIGKNPAIDKIDNLSSMDVKIYAIKKMEQTLILGGDVQSETYMRQVPIDFGRVNWKGNTQ